MLIACADYLSLHCNQPYAYFTALCFYEIARKGFINADMPKIGAIFKTQECTLMLYIATLACSKCYEGGSFNHAISNISSLLYCALNIFDLLVTAGCIVDLYDKAEYKIFTPIIDQLQTEAKKCLEELPSF